MCVFVNNMKKQFNLKNSYRRIKLYENKCFFETKDIEFKPFYNVFKGEFGFLRFHIKAIKYRDWKSIKCWWQNKYYL